MKRDSVSDSRLVDDIKAMGGSTYLDVRQLEDGTVVGIGRLLYTTAIYVDLSIWGYGQRFCFDDPNRAVVEYRQLATGNDEPQGWIARRPLAPCK